MKAVDFKHPDGMPAMDAEGNVYVADVRNHQIHKITPKGVMIVLAGSGKEGFKDGIGTEAQFNCPRGLSVDAAGNVYVADLGNHMIRKITPEGAVSTLAGSGIEGFKDGIGTEAQFNFPSGVSVDAAGNVYVADSWNHMIRKITPGGMVSTFAGSGIEGFKDGIGTDAQFSYPNGVFVDDSGNVYVADTFNHRIRKITSEGAVSTLAGSGKEGFKDGIGTEAQFSWPRGLSVDGSGNVFVADFGNHMIRKITPGGAVSTFAGSGIPGFKDGAGTEAQFADPEGVFVDGLGNAYVVDTRNNRIRKITLEGTVSTFAA